jgi:hypothetical protein
MFYKVGASSVNLHILITLFLFTTVLKVYAAVIQMSKKRPKCQCISLFSPVFLIYLTFFLSSHSTTKMFYTFSFLHGALSTVTD